MQELSERREQLLRSPSPSLVEPPPPSHYEEEEEKHVSAGA